MTPFVPLDPLVLSKNPFRAIINMPSSALHIRLKGSYTLNNLLVEYKQLGPEFYTFGNPYMTNNIREFMIKDRLSLLGRRLMFVEEIQSDMHQRVQRAMRESKLTGRKPDREDSYAFRQDMPPPPELAANKQQLDLINLKELGFDA